MKRRSYLILVAALWLVLALFAAPIHVYAGSPPLQQTRDTVGDLSRAPLAVTSTQSVTSTVPGQEAEGEDTTGEEKDAVPPSDLTQALGVLGLFAAVMAVLAVGTEVVVDTIKLVIGMKSKPTALEAMERLEALLPGKLQEFGASADAQKQVDGYLKGLRVVMEDMQTVQESIVEIRQGRVLEALQKLHGLLPTELQNRLAQSQQAAADYVLQFLDGKVDLNQPEKDHIRGLITGLFTDLSADNAVALQADLQKRLDGLVNELLALTDTAVQRIEPWLKENLPRLAERGPNVLIQEAEGSILKQLPLTPEQRQQVSAWLKSTVSGLDMTAQADLNNYLISLTGLLDRVNKERYEIQSPARKLWRHLRGIQFLGIGKLFEGLERIWNWFLRRTPKGGLDEPRSKAPELSLTNAAAVIMGEEARHRDEEASRLRWLRVVSVIAGVWLASFLGINAGELLRNVFPGLEPTLLKTVENVVSGVDYGALGDLLGAIWNLSTAVPLLGPMLESLLPRVAELELGVVLSGLGAAAGSTFWHDQLDRLQTAKKASEQLDQLRAQVRELQSGGVG
jgi:hypothetical protein